MAFAKKHRPASKAASHSAASSTLDTTGGKIGGHDDLANLDISKASRSVWWSATRPPRRGCG